MEKLLLYTVIVVTTKRYRTRDSIKLSKCYDTFSAVFNLVVELHADGPKAYSMCAALSGSSVFRHLHHLNAGPCNVLQASNSLLGYQL